MVPDCISTAYATKQHSRRSPPGLGEAQYTAIIHDAILNCSCRLSLFAVCLLLGEVWGAECRQLWCESVTQAHLHLGGGTRQLAAPVAQAPACLPVLPAHHQPAWQCPGQPAGFSCLLMFGVLYKLPTSLPPFWDVVSLFACSIIPECLIHPTIPACVFWTYTESLACSSCCSCCLAHECMLSSTAFNGFTTYMQFTAALTIK